MLPIKSAHPSILGATILHGCEYEVPFSSPAPRH